MTRQRSMFDDETCGPRPADQARALPSVPPAAQASLNLTGGLPQAAGPFSGPRAAPFHPQDVWPFKNHRTLAQVDADQARIRRLFRNTPISEIRNG